MLSRFIVKYGIAQDGYGPPSPATQFMMSPQNSVSYNYGYSFSPGRKKSRPRTAEKSHDETSRPTAMRGILDKLSPIRLDTESPTTVGSSAESESLHEAT